MNIDFPSERVIEDYVFAKIQETRECPISGNCVDLCLRQHEIKGYGIADLINISIDPWSVDVTVVELKNEILKESHLSQISRYMTAISRQLRRYQRHSTRSINVFGQLAGPFSLEANDMVFLLEQIPSISVYALSLTMAEGFQSKEISSGWHRTTENLLGAKPLVRRAYELGHLEMPPKENVLAAKFSGRGFN